MAANTIRSRFDILSRGLKRERGTMNKLETQYSEALTADPDVYKWWFEPLTLRLSHPDKGQPARFAPDFLVLYHDGTTCLDDVKSAFGDKASGVRAKCAAELYPLWKFRRVMKRRVKDGGGWNIEEV